MTIINGTEASPPEEEAATLPNSEYGPRRVKTKEMEIEAFSPMEVIRARERENSQPPTFCGGPHCVGRYKDESS
jgi:hypothetical protein